MEGDRCINSEYCFMNIEVTIQTYLMSILAIIFSIRGTVNRKKSACHFVFRQFKWIQNYDNIK